MRNHDLVSHGSDRWIESAHQLHSEPGRDQLRQDERRTEPGAMPAKVLLNTRAIVTAGLAKLAEEVNQWTAPM